MKKEKRKKKERKSRTPVMPRDGMRIEEPCRGQWCENEKKKEEWRGNEVPDFCYASRWHGGRGTWSWTVELRKKNKEKKRKKKRKRANEGSVSRGLLLLFYPVK